MLRFSFRPTQIGLEMAIFFGTQCISAAVSHSAWLLDAVCIGARQLKAR